MVNQNILLLISILGLILSLYITYKRSKKEKLICRIGNDCDKVLNSKYSNVIKIPNEILGVIYFAALILSTILFNIYPSYLTSLIETIRIIITGISAFVALTLIYVQIKILKELCEYCLAVDTLIILVFITLIL